MVSTCLRLLPKRSNLVSSVHSTFFQSSIVQSLFCCVQCSLLNPFFVFNRGVLTDTQPLSSTERSLLLTAITDIGCWCVEFSSVISKGAFLFARHNHVSIFCKRCYSGPSRFFSVNILHRFLQVAAGNNAPQLLISVIFWSFETWDIF